MVRLCEDFGGYARDGCADYALAVDFPGSGRDLEGVGLVLHRFGQADARDPNIVDPRLNVLQVVGHDDRAGYGQSDTSTSSRDGVEIVEELRALPKLRQLFLWQTKVTPAAAAALS